MSLRIYINSEIIPNSGFYQLPDHTIPTSSPRYPSGELIIHNTGLTTIDVTGITKASWARNMAVSGLTLPITLTSGASRTGMISVTPFGPDVGLDTTFRPGCPFGRWTFAYTSGTAVIDVAARMKRQVATTGYSFPTTGEFASYWVVDGWSISAADTTPQNPMSIGWNIWTSGYTRFGLDYVKPALDAGQKAFLFWQPWGETHNIYLQDPSSIQFDGYLHAQEYGVTSGNNNSWAEWEDFLDYVYSYPDTVVYVYNGTMREDPDFINPILASGATTFIDRGFGSIQHLLRRRNMFLCCDIPSNYGESSGTNPLVQPGEPRYELLNMAKNILTSKGGGVYYEPRPHVTQTHWHGASGWNHVMIDQTYMRNNPDWYTDATGSLKDADCGHIMRWVIESNLSLLPYQIADTMINSGQCLLNVGQLWYRVNSGTLDTLYNNVKTHVDFCNEGIQA